MQREFGQSMGIASHLYADFIAQLLRPHDLTYSQFTVLLYLARAGRPSRVSDIAQAVALTQSAATKIVQKFQTAGWVNALRDPSDARNRPVVLTAQGGARLGAVQASFGPAFGALLNGIDPAELAGGIAFMQMMIARLDEARKKLHP